jgi:molybdopterin-guanine dinucleotide biosynthesis protein A
MTSSHRSEQQTILGVVLCGGRSRRMGRDKANLCDDQGKSFLSIATERLEKVCSRVALSAAAERPSEYPTICDLQPEIGPIGGIWSSLRFAQQHQFTACLFTPVDTPGLTVADLNRLINAYRNSSPTAVCAVSGSNIKRVEPLIAIYPVTWLPTFQQAIEAGRFGLQALLAKHSPIRVSLSSASCHNINTPDDLMNS